jgi:predicted DNA-binding protein
MAPSTISDKRKKRGRPATGVDPMYGARLSNDLVERLDAWAKTNRVSRSEAIRRLIELGLKKR